VKTLLWTRAVARGVFGTSRFWLVVAIFMGAMKLKDRFLDNGPETVYSEKLEPGKALLITNLEPATTMEA
jgi:hypothetical protein